MTYTMVLMCLRHTGKWKHLSVHLCVVGAADLLHLRFLCQFSMHNYNFLSKTRGTANRPALSSEITPPVCSFVAEVKYLAIYHLFSKPTEHFVLIKAILGN